VVGIVGWAALHSDEIGPEEGGVPKAKSENLESPSRGSTGKSDPESLEEQLAMEEVMSQPENGVALDKIKMNDQRWPSSEGWKKWSQIVNGTEIHYVGNSATGKFDDFKFKR
jgi:hypothetical protein